LECNSRRLEPHKRGSIARPKSIDCFSYPTQFIHDHPCIEEDNPNSNVYYSVPIQFHDFPSGFQASAASFAAQAIKSTDDPTATAGATKVTPLSLSMPQGQQRMMVDPLWCSTASRQVQRGTIDHINPISATRMTPVPTPTRNNPTSACMSHPVGINSLRAFGCSAIISPRRRSALSLGQSQIGHRHGRTRSQIDLSSTLTSFDGIEI
jgi:hypothetical protein